MTLGLALLAGGSLLAFDAPAPTAANPPPAVTLASDPGAAWKQIRAA